MDENSLKESGKHLEFHSVALSSNQILGMVKAFDDHGAHPHTSWTYYVRGGVCASVSQLNPFQILTQLWLCP